MTSDLLPTDTILLRLQGSPLKGETFAQSLAAFPVCAELGVSVVRHAWSEQVGMSYVYLALPARIAVSRRTLAPLEGLASDATQVEISRLALMCKTPGASQGQHASFHYVVEMTPEVGWEVELQRWYDSEHLPGLANVQGCVHARRFWNYDDGPQSLACYDLVDAHAMGSPAWLAVRHTPWSDRMRPRFTHTMRTMFTLPD